MTGFGRIERDVDGKKIVVEIRSFNHRYRDTVIKLPRKYAILEERAKGLISSYINRGRVEISVQVNGGISPGERLELDMDLARSYLHVLTRLKEELSISGDVSLECMIGLKDIVTLKEEGEDIEYVWEVLRVPLEQALSTVEQMRIEEGGALRDDLVNRLTIIDRVLGEIKDRSPSIVLDYQNRLWQRIKSHVGDVDIDQNRLAQEVAYFAERSDITEEIVRSQSHLSQFRKMLDHDQPIGRKLEFLLQELNREVNTIGAKAQDALISQKVVDVKSELEKLREQVQNIE
jgi:uncharacterized protein (TIGR00255 family)